MSTLHPADGQQLREVVKGLRFAMLTTINDGGLLTSKPMTVLDIDAQGHFWFYCQATPGNPYARANLAFSDESSSRYVSVAGRGEIVSDRTRVKELWSLMAKPWFPEGPDSPDLVCLKFVPLQAELWSGPGNGLTQALAIAASVVAGKPVGMGDHQVLGAMAPDTRTPTVQAR